LKIKLDEKNPMSFKLKTVMEQRQEFVLLANHPEANIKELCERFGLSRKTGYKWLNRYKAQGTDGLRDKSRCPRQSPNRMDNRLEQEIITIRKDNPEWGAKKIMAIMRSANKFSVIPALSTINKILKRNGLVSVDKSMKAQRWQRYEHPYPNALWQMDFKGYFDLLDHSTCHPLTILDDHSRFNIGLFACKDEKHYTVQQYLTNVFRIFGLPEMILADNGSPWGAAGNLPDYGIRAYTKLEKWLMRLQVKIIHGQAYHPQTQGKEERFHRTLKTELLQYEQFKNYSHCQQRFDWWREKYNCQRPHEAISFDVPAKRYIISNRVFPEMLLPVEYPASDSICKVREGGLITFKKKEYRVGKAFIGDYVALRQTSNTTYEIYYCNQLIRILNLQPS
jgi:transposase InsO family protein